VLDEALNGVVLSKDKKLLSETEEGFVMTFFVNVDYLKWTIPVI
jgi:hypothetical protein